MSVKLSASRIATYQKCTWLYWTKYVLRLPDSTNTGALQGNCCHTICECLLKSRHKKLYDNILSGGATIENEPVIERFVRKFIKKEKLPEESFAKIDAMIVVALGVDFFCKGGKIVSAEMEFDIANELPPYHIKGYMDKPAIYDDKFIRIVDYKSSKKQYQGEELVINPQAMIYSLAAKKLWPHLTPIVDFIFLQFPKDPIQRLRFSDQQLRGFELFLSDIQEKLDSFTREDAVSDLAAKQPYTKDGGFKGPLVCGRAKKKGELKKDGTPMYYCPMKFPFSYFALCNEAGETLRTSFVKAELKPKKDKDEFVIKKKYFGCPHFNKK